MEFLYTTEYQRSFLSNLNHHPPQKLQNRLFIQQSFPPISDVTEKCSIGIQTNPDTKRVHFKQESNRNPINHTQIVSTPANNPTKLAMKPKNTVSEEALHKQKEKIDCEEKSPVENDLPSHFYHHSAPNHYAFDLKAGRVSEDYQRAPFISKKKKVQENPFVNNPLMYHVSSEPCLQKKRISMYPKNHNILRTHTVKESEDSSLSSPNKFVSSYSLDFDEKPQRYQSPIMSAVYTMNRKNSSSSVHSALSNEFEDSHRFHKKHYNKGNYETEYRNIFTNKDSEQNKLVSPLLDAVKDNEEFANYYKQVLNKRIYAYSPSLRESSSSAKSYSPPNEKHYFDEKQSEKLMDDYPLPTTTQRYVKGGYTRDYQPDLYSPRHD